MNPVKLDQLTKVLCNFRALHKAWNADREQLEDYWQRLSETQTELEALVDDWKDVSPSIKKMLSNYLTQISKIATAIDETLSSKITISLLKMERHLQESFLTEFKKEYRQKQSDFKYFSEKLVEQASELTAQTKQWYWKGLGILTASNVVVLVIMFKIF